MERELERDDEWVVDEREHRPLCQDMCNLTRSLRDMCFADGLECINPLRVLLPDLHHFSKAPFPDDLEEIKCLDRKWFISNGLEVYFEVKGPGTRRCGIPLVRGMLLGSLVRKMRKSKER